MEKKKNKIKGQFDDFKLDQLNSLFDGSGIESLEDFISREIEAAQKLSEVSNDPIYYLGKVSAFQDLRDHIRKIIEYYNEKYRGYREFRFDELSDALTKIQMEGRKNAKGE